MKQKIKKLFQEIGVLSLSLTIVFILVMGIAIVKGWTEPTVAPPGGNLGAPINTSANTQIKSGALGVGALGVGTNPPISGAVIHAASNEDGDFESLTATNDKQQTGFHGLRARGSIVSPQIVQTGDYAATFLGMAFNGSDYTTMGGMHVRLDPNDIINSGNMPSILEFATHKGSKNNSYGTQMTLDSDGNLTVNGNVGIGTADPKKKLEVSGGDVYVNQTSGELIMKSPDGTCSSCGPNNSDVWSCVSVSCP